jgi:hypothetical protein
MCKLDSGSFAACSSPKDYAGPLAQGSHTFQVEAKDAAGNISGPASWTWVVDTTPPDAPTIQVAPFAWPPIGWGSTNASFAFSDSSSDVASYQCKLDAGPYAVCVSPKSYSGLAQGQHTFKVKAIDQAGNVSNETSWTFFVDAIPPNQPTLTGNPSNPSSSQSATFSWTDTDPGYPSTGSGIAGYACKLDSGNWEFCSSPKTYNNLSFSSHTFQVVAIDWAGNTSQPRSYTWTVANTSTGMPFTISGSVGGLVPGVWKTIPVLIGNPNADPLYITSLNVSVAVSSPNGCSSAANIETAPSNASVSSKVGPVPAGAPAWPVPDGSNPTVSQPRPRIRLTETGGNQDVCKSQTFNLTFTGQGTNEP